MKILYNITVFFYSLLIKLASNFNNKAKLRNNGANRTFSLLNSFNAEKTIWFHCSSLGEFEQARTLIEKIKKEKQEYKIALSFFSPSGYEIQKNYDFADIVFYLPGDNKRNAEKLINCLKPEIAFFIKYEFWYWYLFELKNRAIPVYLVSGIFRKKQIFFKPSGSFYRKILLNFEHLFIQNKTSKELLNSIGITNTTITGDTRFDRVFEISKIKKNIPLINKFKGEKFIFIAGSTWKKDEEIIFEFINKRKDNNLKFIIAPHEIKQENIERIIRLSTKKILRFSKANNENIINTEILIIDSIGMLSSLYAYADIAYIGGGFGAGIHNTLEAAVFGIPIIFGPKYQKFNEAKELIKRKAAFSISNYQLFNKITDEIIINKDLIKSSGKKSNEYVNENIGASEKIFKFIFKS